MKGKGKSKGKKLKFGKKTRMALCMLLAVVIVLLAVFLALQNVGNITVNNMKENTKKYFESLGAGDGFPYEQDAENIKDFCSYDSNLFVLFGDKTVRLTSTAKEIAPTEHDFLNPMMKTKDSKAIVYDLDSFDFRIQEPAEVKYTGKSDGKIMAAAIGKRGNYAIGAYGDNVQSVLTVYNNKNKAVFKWNFKSERISDIALSDNGSYAAVTTLYSDEGEISSKVYMFSFRSTEPVACTVYKSSVLVKVDFIKDDNIVVVGDNIRSYIKDGKTRKEDLQFNSDVLHNYSVSNNGSSVIVRSKFGSSGLSTMTVYNNKNKELFTQEFQKEVKWADTGEKYTAVLFENEVLTYNKKGDEVGKIAFTGVPVRVAVDGNKVYVLTSVSLQCYNVKGNV